LWNDTRASGDWASAAKEFRKLRKKDNEFEKQCGFIPQSRSINNQARQKTMGEFMRSQ
jgi:hypothetical protein